MEPRINFPKVAPGALEAMLGFSVRARRFSSQSSVFASLTDKWVCVLYWYALERSESCWRGRTMAVRARCLGRVSLLLRSRTGGSSLDGVGNKPRERSCVGWSIRTGSQILHRRNWSTGLSRSQ